MNKKILISLSVVVAVAALAVGGTIAFFSDTETSTGNTFTAGAIDLQIDSTATYNGQSVPGSTWALMDLNPTADKFFNFADIKPGDEGENTISLHVINNDAWVCAEVSNLTNQENDCTEPESSVDQTCDNPGVGDGELQDNLVFTIWKDDGTGLGEQEPCDNVQQDNEPTLLSGNPVNGVLPVYDSTTQDGPLAGGQTSCLGVAWSLPLVTGNEVQTDSMTGDISFSVVQSRNNEQFVCGGESTQPEIISVQSATFNLSSTGWAGWSCPVSHPNIVSADTTNCAQPLAVSEVAKPGENTYPVYPHYTYTPPETGWVIQNGGTGQSCSITLQCQAN